MNNIIDKIKNNKVISNISWILFGRLIYMILNFIVGLLSARYLGPSNYGLIGYAAAYTTFFSSICTLGINSIIIKEFVDNPKKEGKIIGTSLLLKFISSMLSLITIIGICFIVDDNEPITRCVVFLYSISIVFQIFETFKYWFQSRLESKYSEIAVTIAYVFMAIYKIILLITNKSVNWFAISNSIEYFVVAILLLYLYKKKGGQRLTFSREYAKEILKKSYHFIISGLMVAVYNSTDKFMLKQMLSETSVGYYTTAITLASMTAILLNAIIDSLTPGILQEHKNNKEKYIKKNVQLYSIIFYISAILAVGIFIFAPLIINILYGYEYHGAINPLRILTWYTAFSYLGVARNPWIVSENKQKYLKYIYISCAIINVALNFILIPNFGASGAAFASLITQFATIFIIPLAIKELRSNVKLMLDGLLLKGFDLKKLLRKKDKTCE